MRKKNGRANIKPPAGRLATPRTHSKIPNANEIHPNTRKTIRTFTGRYRQTEEGNLGVFGTPSL